MQRGAPKFESRQQFEVRTEPERGEADVRILKMDDGEAMKVTDFKYQALAERGRGQYHAVKKKFGAIAATDPERHSRSKKDSRFTMNELLRGPLAVEDEERKAIEEKVRVRVETLSEEAMARAGARGYEDGLKLGQQEAFIKFKEEGAGVLAQFESLVTSFENAKRDIFLANERVLIEFLFRVAGMVALKEIKQDPQYLTRLCREMIDRVGVRENIRIRVHPDKLAAAAALKGDLEQIFGKLTNLSVDPSPDIMGEGCQVETEWNSIDATFERQLEGVRAALFADGEGGRE